MLAKMIVFAFFNFCFILTYPNLTEPVWLKRFANPVANLTNILRS